MNTNNKKKETPPHIFLYPLFYFILFFMSSPTDVFIASLNWLDKLIAFDRCALYGPRVGLTRLERLDRAIKLELEGLTPDLIALIQTHWTSGIVQKIAISTS